jgi:hypothetical protein
VLTLNLHTVIFRLLYKLPSLAAWLDFCDIYLEKDVGHFNTQLIIECQFSAVAELFLSQHRALINAIALGVPMNISIVYRGRVVVAYRGKDLQSLHQATSNVRGYTMVSTTIERNTTISNTQAIVNLGNITEPIQGMIRQQLVDLKLPVFPREDGNYDVPQNSFDAAWQSLGDRMKRMEEFIGVSESEVTDRSGNEATASKPKAKTKTTSTTATERTGTPRLFYPALTPDDITTGNSKASVKKTWEKVQPKIGTKTHTIDECLSAIANRTEYGIKLLAKIGEVYGKKDVLYKLKPEEWTKVEGRIVTLVQEQINTPPSNTKVEDTEATATTAES